MARRTRLLLLALLLALLPRAVSASCESPQDAARSLLDNLQPGSWKPEAAAECLELAPGQEDRAGQVAIRLKKVLDARGLYVPTDDLPTKPDFADEEGRARVVPVPSAPWLFLARRAGRWVWPVEVVGRTDELYAETFTGLGGTIRGLLPPALDVRLLGLETWQLLYFLLLLAVSIAAGKAAQKLVADQLVRIAHRLRVELSVEALRGTRTPLTWFATGVVFRVGVPDLELGVRAAQTLLVLADAVVSLSVVLMVSRLVDVASDLLAQRAARTESKMDDQVIPLVSRAAKVATWVLGIVFVVQNMGVDVGSLLAGLGIGGLAFALAAKDTVENLFGSLTVFTDRPFQIGDWVVLDGKWEGVVEEVGFRTTRIRTFHNSVISVPNRTVANAAIDNMGKRRWRRVTTTLGVTYDTPREKLEAFVSGVREAIRSHPATARDATLEVHFKDFGDSALEIMVYFFLDVPDWSAELTARDEIFREFLRVAEDLGVSFAFPSTSVYLEKLPAGAVRRHDDGSAPAPA